MRRCMDDEGSDFSSQKLAAVTTGLSETLVSATVARRSTDDRRVKNHPHVVRHDRTGVSGCREVRMCTIPSMKLGPRLLSGSEITCVRAAAAACSAATLLASEVVANSRFLESKGGSSSS